jgi:hypothetical protein
MEICNNIDQNDTPSDEYTMGLKDSCYYTIALETLDANICNLISSIKPDARNSCIETVTREKGIF